MPWADAAMPRKMLPPPMTMATSTPEARTSAISDAMPSRVGGSMPKPALPMRASPDNFSRIRLKRGAAEAMEPPRGWLRQSGLLGNLGGEVVLLLFQTLAELPTDEAADLDVLAELRHQLRQELADRLLALGVTHPDLLEEANVLLPLGHLPFDDLRDHRLGDDLQLLARLLLRVARRLD